MEQLSLKKFFSRSCTLIGKKWCTIDLWWLINMLYEQKWCSLKSICVSFHKWNNFCLRNFSLGLANLEEKRDVQLKLTFDDSYICYVSKSDVF